MSGHGHPRNAYRIAVTGDDQHRSRGCNRYPVALDVVDGKH
jgi:hypothetical protein